MNNQAGFPVFFTEASAALGRYDSNQAEAEAIAALGHFPRQSSILDVGCGIGRMSKALHDLDMRVVGIDLSAEQIALAQWLNPGPNYLVADAAAPPGGPYAGVVSIYSSFGYCDTPEQDATWLAAWAARLKSGGRLIMELSDLERARHRLGTATFPLLRQNGNVEEQLTMDWDRSILSVVYRRGDCAFECKTRLYTQDQLVDLLETRGFDILGCHGGFDGRPKQPNDRLVILARRR
jgi:SAM-dependent methyltransferase